MRKNLNYLVVLLFPLLFTCCQDRQKINTYNSNQSVKNDTLIPFSIELVKKLENKIEWSRIEFDSVTSQKARIHRPIFYLCEKNDFVESVDIDLYKYFTKKELNRLNVHPIDSGIIKKYGVVNLNTVRYWYEESERLRLEDSEAVIPLSFHWYFGVSGPILSGNGKYIYLEIFESNADKSVFWVYVFKKERSHWKRFYVKRIGVKAAL